MERIAGFLPGDEVLQLFPRDFMHDQDPAEYFGSDFLQENLVDCYQIKI